MHLTKHIPCPAFFEYFLASQDENTQSLNHRFAAKYSTSGKINKVEDLGLQLLIKFRDQIKTSQKFYRNQVFQLKDTASYQHR